MESHPLLDRNQLNKLESLGGHGLIEKIIDVFLESTPKRIHALLVEKEKRLFADIGFAAHSLKSSAGNLGARELQFLCEALELACEQGEMINSGILVPQVLASYDKTCDALRAERERIRK